MVMEQAMYRTGERPAGPLAVSTSGLTKRFGDRTVVDDVALAIPSGSVCGFVGPNGAGKNHDDPDAARPSPPDVG